MGSKKQFIDEVFTTFEISSLIERHKCRATGKVRFNSRSEASFFMHWLKWRYKKWRLRPDRRKRNFNKGQGRPKQRYVYSCTHCKGYHITKENPYDFNRKKEKYQMKYFE